jgi:peptidoglycan/xylan/chitin deacetylase (PgdA/CDA1 family)
VVITVDDGHRSVYEKMLPIVLREHFPVTLFVYPSAISNASYALTWDQLRNLRQTGLFDVQSHTYWHPNFKVERGRRSEADFRQFVRAQLDTSRQRIESEAGGFSHEVWQHNLDVAEEAARMGFDEIQFDYVRFPDASGLRFALPNTRGNRTAAIVGFLQAARARLAPYNVFVSADIFGYVCWNLDDQLVAGFPRRLNLSASRIRTGLDDAGGRIG